MKIGRIISSKQKFKMLVLAILVGVAISPDPVVAQSNNWGGKMGQWDMWSPHWMQRHMWNPDQMGPRMQRRMARHWTFMHKGIPTEYHGTRNPYSSEQSVIEDGRVLYQENCASCHGVEGTGDGEVANSLSPSPALLAYMIHQPMSVDEYMLWSIAEGGESFETDMPAFKDTLSTDEIWKIITYMRAGFPK